MIRIAPFCAIILASGCVTEIPLLAPAERSRGKDIAEHFGVGSEEEEGTPENPNVGNGTDDPGPTPSACEDTDAIILGSTPLRRLTNVEYDNTVRDLFGNDTPALPVQPPDAVMAGSFENNAGSLGPSDVRISRYRESARALAAHALESATAMNSVLPCDTEDAQCASEFVASFGRKAFRRPLSAAEQESFLNFFEQHRATIDFDAAVEITIASMLQSPQFLYRIEKGVPDSSDNGQIQLTSYEIASRLSYFIWESMPDEELFLAAAADELNSAEELEEQVRRMLLDPRARDTIRNFHRQWLYTDRVLGEDKVPDLFPMWSDATKNAAAEESMRFVENTILAGGTVEELLLSTTAYVDDNIAELYGVDAPAQSWDPVELNPAERAGLLTRVAFLAGNAHAANGSPPLRGVYLMERMLCEPRPSPPADADTSVPEAAPGEGPFTNRDLFEQRTSPASCQSCHVRIDGFGFGFEHYDAAGMYRSEDNGLPVNASGYGYGLGADADYDGAIELSQLLADSGLVEDCVATQWLTYMVGRRLQEADSCRLASLQDDLEATGGNIVELLVQITRRPEFRLLAEVSEE